VARCINIMRGGEIFVPKIPSMKIIDLATSVCPACEHHIVGIRPGEKLHELLITRDDARHTVEFSDFYLIKPAIDMWHSRENATYEGNAGKPVSDDFEYGSDNNTRWIGVDQLADLIG
jgi:UDP-N-acetylglucosamine 4,6-dehydratase